LIEDMINEKLPHQANENSLPTILFGKFDRGDEWLPTRMFWPFVRLLLLRLQEV